MSGSDKKISCVIGWPAGHSRSPLIHNYWIQQHKLNAEYRKEAVPPEGFEAFVKSLRDRGYAGANVTLPHKEMALALSKPDERAQAVGAANTLYFENDTLRSTNTDVEGFLANLDASVKDWDRGLESAVVLGAGGAARGVVHALLSRGVQQIHVVNRTAGRADEIAKRFGSHVSAARWDAMKRLLEICGLVVNTTSLGMRGQPPLDIDLRCPSSAVVAEIVYDPLETPLLKAARAKELRTADGLGMLLHQAVRGFQLWFGTKPEVTADLRALVEADLRKGRE